MRKRNRNYFIDNQIIILNFSIYYLFYTHKVSKGQDMRHLGVPFLV